MLETLLAALALPGGTVLVHSPCCWQVLRALTRASMRVLEVPLDARGNPDLHALARLLGSEPVCMLVMPSCLGMPQGRLVAPHYQQQLGQLLGQHPVWLL
ncbi:putative HTH-type transcriptional regulator YdcR [compost metagenome]